MFSTLLGILEGLCSQLRVYPAGARAGIETAALLDLAFCRLPNTHPGQGFACQISWSQVVQTGPH